MSTWKDIFGSEPTADPQQIEKIARRGPIGVVLNDLPLDGPLHPAELYIDQIGPEVVAITLCCPTTDRRVLAEARGEEQIRRMLLSAGNQAQAWGCTYMALHLHGAA